MQRNGNRVFEVLRVILRKDVNEWKFIVIFG